MSYDDEQGEDAFTSPDSVPADWVRQILAFWFDGHGQSDWFGGGPAFDAKCEAFAPWREALRSLPASHFLTDPDTARAAIILFDQIPRNLYRKQAEAFATDQLAVQIARGAVDKGFDEGLSDDARAFLYMPFEHSENMDDQRASLRLMNSINPDYGQYAQAHYDMIDRFGRFPHRNKALGRTDRDGEAEAIAQGENW